MQQILPGEIWTNIIIVPVLHSHQMKSYCFDISIYISYKLQKSKGMGI